MVMLIVVPAPMKNLITCGSVPLLGTGDARREASRELNHEYTSPETQANLTDQQATEKKQLVFQKFPFEFLNQGNCPGPQQPGQGKVRVNEAVPPPPSIVLVPGASWAVTQNLCMFGPRVTIGVARVAAL